MAVENSADSTLDIVLTEAGGFGIYQGFTFFLVCSLNILSSFSMVNYMISATTLDYRCKVPECEIGANRALPFNQSWLHNAIPFKDETIDKCHRYAPMNNTHNLFAENDACGAELFDVHKKIECTEFVYGSDETNLQTQLNIHCSEEYKLALIGTIGNVGRFMFLPIYGLLADKYGRVPGYLIGLTLASACAVIKSFSVNYYMYLVFEFLEASAGAVGLNGPYLIAVEWMNTKNRVLANTIVSISFPLGEMIFGAVAMFVHDSCTLTQILHIPGLFVFIYFWLIPESCRWLLETGRVDRAIDVLKRTAKFNRKKISPKSIEMLRSLYESKLNENNSIEEKDNEKVESHTVMQSLRLIMKSKKFSIRLLLCYYQWVACTFSYYGVSLSATHIPGAYKYVSFIVVMASEVPGMLLAQPLLTRFKRRVLMFGTMFFGAVMVVVTPFVPTEYSALVLVCFVLGKASFSCAFTVLYVYTMEQWPTNIRNTVMNSCSMIGRIGSMVAPLTMVLAQQSASISTILFGASAVLSALTVLFTPETFGKKLPDTMEEAQKL